MVASNFVLAAAAFFTLAAAAPKHSPIARAVGGVVTGVPANPIQFPGKPGSDRYKMCANGDGHDEAAGWPARQSWMSFGDMWTANSKVIGQGCAWMNVANNSPAENKDLHDAILQASTWSAMDPRFILAMVMQESSGCVRVHTTNNGVRNPGLLQDHDGVHTCNDNNRIQNPCPKEEITYMVSDGIGGTPAGDGIAALVNKMAANTGVSSAWPFYKAARVYNSGSIGAGGDLNAANGATASYACDVANRVMGWVSAPRSFNGS